MSVLAKYQKSREDEKNIRDKRENFMLNYFKSFIAVLSSSLFSFNISKFLYLSHSDRWNFFDIIMLIIFFCVILPMRIATWTDSESVTNNRTLQIAESLYGLNAMLLVFRAFGSILETSKGVGTVQIALFHIIMEATVVVLHFIAITLAFSSTMTKLFVSEVSFREGNTTEGDR